MTGSINDDAILQAFESVNRELFVPEIFSQVAYIDGQITIAKDRFLLEPLVLARMIVAAELKSSDNVLDIACGSGYSSAVISLLAGKVSALEENQDLLAKAKNLLGVYPNIEVVEGELTKGDLNNSPYDVIFIQGSIGFLPQEIIDQVREGGRIIAIEHSDDRAYIGGAGLGKVVKYDKIDGQVYKNFIADAFVKPLAGFTKKQGFRF